MSNGSLALGFIKAGAGTKWISIFPQICFQQRLIAFFDTRRLVRSVETA